MTFPFAIPVTVLKSTVTGIDQYGVDVKTWTPRATSGAFDPGGSVELVQGQDMVTTSPTVFLPPNDPITAYDRVTVAGLTYEVDGGPNSYLNPFTGWNPGTVVKLKQVTG